MGGTVGIAVGQTLYTSILRRKIKRIPDLSGFDTSPAGLSDSVRTLRNLPVSDEAEILLFELFMPSVPFLQEPERGQIIHAFTKSIAAIWVLNVPLVGIGFIMGEKPTHTVHC